jgi:hypothetical protein
VALIQYYRTPWPADFPDVVIHAPLAERDIHPSYSAAKAGSMDAARHLVEDLLSEESVRALESLVGVTPVLLVGISAIETLGFNAIPDAMANELNIRLNWPIEAGELRQCNKVGHTRASSWHRFVTQAEFTGEVMAGANYVLVDDHVGFGGTLANLRGYIEHQGGTVIGMTTLTETPGARRIALQGETLRMLREKHGDPLEELWQENFGHGLDCCTQLEASYLCRQQSLDYIRRRMAKAAKKARERNLSPIQVDR